MEWLHLTCLLWITVWSVILIGIWINMLGDNGDE